MIDLMTFIWASLTSPHGMCVAMIFAALIWLQVGIVKIRDRHAERAHLAELNAMLADLPAPPRTHKTLIPPMPKGPSRAA